jgi:peptide/nickel transport system substrate-binding protein
MTMIGRRSLLAAGLLGVAGRAAAAEARTLRFVPHARLRWLDPSSYDLEVTRAHGFMVFDTLYALDAAARPRPQMAEGHEWLQGFTRLVIRLREGLRFHDGARVTARDVIASLRRWTEADVAGRLVGARLDEAVALNDRTLRLRFDQPQPLFLEAITRNRPLFVMPADLLAAAGHGPVAAMIGSGPFRFLDGEWAPSEHAAYARFEGYLPRAEPAEALAGGKRVHFDRVEWRFAADPLVAAEWVQAGAVDWWEPPAPGIPPLLRDATAFRLQTVNAWGFLAALRPNHRQPPFQEEGFRFTVAQLIDQAAVMRAVAGSEHGSWRAPVGFFTPGSPFAAEPATLPPAVHLSAEERRALLARAGHAGKRLVLLHPHDEPAHDRLTLAVAGQLSEAGLEVELRPMPWTRLEEVLARPARMEDNDWSALALAFSGAEALTPLTHAYLRAPQGNPVFGWPESPEIERHVQAWVNAPSFEQQYEAAREIEAAAFKGLPYIPLGHFNQAHIIRRDLTGVLRAPVPVMWNVRRA